MKAGFGKSDITPRLGVQLAGYGPYRNRAATEVLAPLYARAMVVESGRQRSVVVSLELCGLPRELDQRIRDVVAKRAKCAPDQVFLSVTHTHSSPAVGGMEGWGEADAMYVETLPSRVATAVNEAMTKRAVATLSWAEAPCAGIAVNRETDSGFALEANFAERIKPGWRPEHPEQTDPTVRVMAFRSGQKLVGLIHHFGCHPVVYGEKTHAIHGDFVGEASRAIETAHPNAVAMFLPGALGDINPKLNHRIPAESKRALAAITRQYTRAIETGLKQAETVAGEHVQSIRREVRFTRKPWNRTSIERRIRKLEALFAKGEITDFPHNRDRSALFTNGMEMARLQGLRKILQSCRGERGPNPPVVLHGLKLGPVVLMGFGLELYHALGKTIMAEFPEEKICLVSLVGGMGYAPDAAAQKRAGYAADFVPLICGEVPFAKIHRELPQALIQAIRRLI
ncbi:MAG: hypothetical protein SynsKO_15400 [Synoicihabitans sp.]